MLTGSNELFPPWTLLATALDLHEVDQKGYFSIFYLYVLPGCSRKQCNTDALYLLWVQLKVSMSEADVCED